MIVYKKKSQFLFLLSLFCLCSFLALTFEDENVKDNKISGNYLTEEQDPVKESSYFSLEPFVIDNDTSNGAGDYTWAEAVNEPWCTKNGNTFIIESVVIDGNNATSCLTIQDSDEQFIIKNCTLYNSSAEEYSGGIFLNNTINGVLIQNNCSYNNRNGIMVFAGENNTIINNTLGFNNMHGIYLRGAHNCSIINNSAHYNKFHGIYLYLSDQTKIYNNYIDNCQSGNGIFTDGIFNSMINNSLVNNSGWGIYAAHKSIMENNNFINKGQGSGIYLLFGKSDNIIRNNLFLNCVQPMVINHDAKNNTIENNIIINFDQSGILIENDCFNNTVRNNTILVEDCPSGFIPSYGIHFRFNCDNNSVYSNYVSDCSGNGLILTDGCDRNNIRKNTLTNNNLGLGLGSGNSTLILGNNISHNDQNGIDLNYCNETKISANFINHNGINGLNLDSTNHTVIEGNVINGNSLGNVEDTNTKGNSLQWNVLNWNAEPLIIDNNGGGDFTWAQAKEKLAWVSGYGTTKNPYLIEDIRINGLNTTNCLSIQDSLVYFEIRNCTFYNASDTPDDAGLYLLRASNGTIVDSYLINNSLHGIYAAYCENLTIEGNIFSLIPDTYGISYLRTNFTFIDDNIIHCSSSCWGMDINYRSNYNRIYENIIYNSAVGIHLQRSSYNNLSRNEIINVTDSNGCGVSLANLGTYGSNNSITRNLIESKWDMGYGIKMTNEGNFDNSIIGNNISGTLRGIFLSSVNQTNLFNNNTIFDVQGCFWISNCENQVIKNNYLNQSSSHGIGIWDSKNFLIANNEIKNSNAFGVCLANTNYSIVKNNLIQAGNSDGISIQGCKKANSIYNNSIFNNMGHGIELLQSLNQNITHNRIYNNDGYGIHMTKSNSSYIFGNRFNGNSFGWRYTENSKENRFLINYYRGAWSYIGIDNNGGDLEQFYWEEIQENFEWCSGSGTYGNPYIIEGITVNGTYKKPGLAISDSTDVYFIIQDCTIMNGSNTIPQNGGGLHLNNVKNGKILYNNCTLNMVHGIYVGGGSSNITIYGNQITHNGYCGIALYDVENSTISNNNCSQNSQDGIKINPFYNITIINNTFIRNDESGLEIFNGEKCTIKNNIFSLNLIGIQVQSGVGKTNIKNNTIYKNNNGITLGSAEPSNRVSFNRILNNTYHGIELTSWILQNNTIIYNLISDNEGWGIVIRGMNNTVTYNDINYNDYGGIVLTAQANHNASYNIINFNNITLNDGTGIYLNSNASNNVISLNILKDNLNIGIYSEDSNKNNITDNFIMDNGQEGIKLQNTNNTRIIGNILITNDGAAEIVEINGENNTEMMNKINGIYTPGYIDNSLVSDINVITWAEAASYHWCSGSGTQNDPYLIENVIINGFNLSNCFSIIDSSVYFEIHNCTFFNSSHENNDAGIFLSSVSNGIIRNNNLSLNNWAGINAQYCENLAFIGNNASKNKEYGLFFWECDIMEVINNTLSNNTVNGIRDWSGGAFWNIFNNTIKNNGEDGIYLTLIENSSIIENSIIYNGKNGLRLDSSSKNNTILNNMIFNNQQNGIQLDKCINTDIECNYISENDQSGLYLDSCENINIIGNNISANQHEGIKLLNCSNSEIMNNIANFNNQNGFYLENCSNLLITLSDFEFNDLNGVYLYNSNNCRIIDNLNSFINNSFCAIFLNYSHHNTITGNSIHNSSIGIYLNRSNYNLIYNNEFSGNILNIYEDNCIGNDFSAPSFSDDDDDDDEKEKPGKGQGPPDVIVIIIIIIIGAVAVGGGITTKQITSKKKKKEKIASLKKKSLPSKEFKSKEIKKKKEIEKVIETNDQREEEKLKSIAKNIELKEDEGVGNISVPIPTVIPKKLKKKKVKQDKKSEGLTPQDIEELKKTENEVDVEKQKLICVVHKGPITGTMYVCPDCQTFYCQKCAKVLQQKGEKCWSCESEIQL